MLNKFVDTNKWFVFLFIIVCYSALQYYIDELLITEDVIYATYSDQLSISQIDTFLAKKANVWWASYLILPIVLCIKFFLVTLSVLTGAVFFDLKISFKKVFGITVLAETVMLIPKLIQAFWFTFVDEMDTIIQFQEFVPWSLVYYLNNPELQQWIKYPLMQINVFEFLYVAMLLILIRKVLLTEKEKTTQVVIVGYGSGLLTWVTFITFLLIQLS